MIIREGDEAYILSYGILQMHAQLGSSNEGISMSEEPGTTICHMYNPTGLPMHEETGHAPRAWALVACHWRTSERASSTGSGAPGGMRVSCTQPTAARPGAVTTVAILLGLSASGFFHASTAMPIAVCMRHAMLRQLSGLHFVLSLPAI